MPNEPTRDYASDPAAWSETQADALRRRAWNELDCENLAEEISALNTSRKDEIYSRLVVALTHLLKWDFQPDQRSNSWRSSIRESRYRIARLIRLNPSLAGYPSTCLDEAYAEARDMAIDETRIRGLPSQCPWRLTEILDLEFWPE